MVVDNAECSLVQGKVEVHVKLLGLTINKRTCLDEERRRQIIVKPTKRNRLDVEEKRSDFTQRMTKEWVKNFGYIERERNSRNGSSHSYGLSKVAKPCIQTIPSWERANLNVLPRILVI